MLTVLSCVSAACRVIVYYCILLSLRSVKDEIKTLITIIITKKCPIVNTYPHQIANG